MKILLPQKLILLILVILTAGTGIWFSIRFYSQEDFEISASYKVLKKDFKANKDFQVILDFINRSESKSDMALGHFFAAYQFKEIDPGKSYQHYLKAFDLFVSLGNTIRAAKSLENIGQLYYLGEDYNNALKYYDHATSLNGDKYFVQKVNIMKGMCYWQKDEREKALIMLLDAKEFFEGENSFLYAESCIKLGNLYFDQAKYSGDFLMYNKAIENYILAKDFYGDTVYVAHTLNNLGNVKIQQDKFDEAESYLKQALGIYTNDEEKASPYFLLGKLSIAKGEFDKSRIYFEKSLELNNSWNFEFDHAYKQLMDYYFEIGDKDNMKLIADEKHERNQLYKEQQNSLAQHDRSNEFTLLERMRELEYQNKINNRNMFILFVVLAIGSIGIWMLLRRKRVQDNEFISEINGLRP